MSTFLIYNERRHDWLVFVALQWMGKDSREYLNIQRLWDNYDIDVFLYCMHFPLCQTQPCSIHDYKIVTNRPFYVFLLHNSMLISNDSILKFGGVSDIACIVVLKWSVFCCSNNSIWYLSLSLSNLYKNLKILKIACFKHRKNGLLINAILHDLKRTSNISWMVIIHYKRYRNVNTAWLM